MMLKMFSVFDSKIKAYLPPFFQRTTGEAERAFSDAVNRQDSGFKAHAEDYSLFELGSWDDQTCKFDLLDTPHSIGVAIQYVIDKE